MIPNENQHTLVLALHLLTEPLKKGGRDVADGTSIDKAQSDRRALWLQQTIATQGFGIAILFTHLPFVQAQWLSVFTPTVHFRLSHATPPHFIGIPHDPAAEPCQRDQGVTPFFFLT
jgi:hypothetical protein